MLLKSRLLKGFINRLSKYVINRLFMFLMPDFSVTEPLRFCAAWISERAYTHWPRTVPIKSLSQADVVELRSSLRSIRSSENRT